MRFTLNVILEIVVHVK